MDVEGNPISGEGTPAGSDPKAGEKTFTQKDVDRIVTDRLGREQKRMQQGTDARIAEALTAFREEHGLDQSALDALAKRDQVAAEHRQLKTALTKAEKEAAEAKGKFAKANSRAVEKTTLGAVLSAAATKSNAPDLLWKAIRDRVTADEEYNLQILGEDGKVSTQNLDQLIDETLARYPQLAKPISSPGSGARPGFDGAPPPPEISKLPFNSPEHRAWRLANLEKLRSA
jgi:hypothetical protein